MKKINYVYCLFAAVIWFTVPAALGSYAQSIVSFTPGNPIYADAPIEHLLGAPDQGYNWREIQGSIGHLGSIVVDMGPEGIVDTAGDDILFWFGGFIDTFEVVEGFAVEAGVDGVHFTFVAQLAKIGYNLEGPVTLFSRNVDLAPSGLSYARYLRITDTGTDLEFRGLELNAIEGLPEPATLVLFGLGGLVIADKKRK